MQLAVSPSVGSLARTHALSKGWEYRVSAGFFFFLRAWRPWVGGSARCAGKGLPTSTAYWRASREEGW
eukprot:6820143-Prymnesium_polylepis.1